MSFDLAVWHSEAALSQKEALEVYRKLCKQEWIPTGQHPSIAAFYDDLCGRYPEIDTLPEAEVDSCPWSCAHDKSGLHVIMCMNYGDELETAAQFIMEIAAKHGLICFDPQGPNVHLPPDMTAPPKRTRFRFW
jgi:hypothetical protein